MVLHYLVMVDAHRESPAGPVQTAHFTDAALNEGAIGRIVVMPLEHRGGIGKSARQLDDLLAASWRQSGRFEVINATMAERTALFTPGSIARKRSVAASCMPAVNNFRPMLSS